MPANTLVAGMARSYIRQNIAGACRNNMQPLENFYKPPISNRIL
jgi:hypothetical protein